MSHSLQNLALVAWCLLPATLCPAAGDSDTPPKPAARTQPRDEVLTRKLDEVVKAAATQARASLPEMVMGPEQALRYAAREYAEQYRVLEHKGWWIVAWCGSGSRPVLWLPGFAIRQCSRDIYHFGSW